MTLGSRFPHDPPVPTLAVARHDSGRLDDSPSHGLYDLKIHPYIAMETWKYPLRSPGSTKTTHQPTTLAWGPHASRDCGSDGGCHSRQTGRGRIFEPQYSTD
jgi:hypothetical protein